MPYLSRRDFIQYAGLGTIAGAVRPVTGPAGLPGAATPPAIAPAPFELEEATIAQLQEGLKSGKYTSRRLCQL